MKHSPERSLFLKKDLEELHGEASQSLTVGQEVHITLVMGFSM